MNCTICLSDKANLPITLPCGHTFCYICIKSVAIATNMKCPLCRAPFNDINTFSYKDTSKNDIQWLYKGKNGWWKYDDESNKKVEELYQEYLENDSSSDSPSDSFSESDSDSDSDTKWKYNLEIGFMKFKIDFKKMRQINKNGNSRKIYRLKKGEEFSDKIKGTAGLFRSSTAEKYID